ncbi:hypothetical protein D915_003645 [Fasciola hepatica]|uniref:Myb-like domain-containing protein n=1 Tax=Fasciola hepatica TaxID=6192 RepID=A0A4E0RDG3_FASHE|nr:hypothetical protein D915_003645 [Fasciola hepatica]
MEFPDDEESGGSVRNTDDGSPAVARSAEIDEDYIPGPADLCILRHDQALDLSPSLTPIDAVSSPVGPGSNLSSCGDQSNQSSATDMDNSVLSETSLTVSSNAVLDDTLMNCGNLFHPRTSPYQTRFGSCRQNSGSARQSPVIEGTGNECQSAGPTTADDVFPIKMDEPSSAASVAKDSFMESGDEEAGDAVEDGVYADFLRSLFPSGSSSENTPCKKSHHCPGVSSQSETPRVLLDTHLENSAQKEQSKRQTIEVSRDHQVDEEDDSDDPEFDVMAELDQVNREDFLDELRDDRAVRISKMEAKSLHQDLHKLFSDEEEDEDGVQPTGRKPHVSAVLAMKSHCHRLLSAKRKLEEPDTPTNTDHSQGAERSDDISSTELPSLVSQPAPVHPKFPPCELSRLQRQLSMHIQLLTTSFLCTFDFSYLHQSVTRPCASALKQLTSLRDAFDLLVHERQTGGTEQLSIRSFYWSAATLNDAVHLISDYAGLSVLPQLSLSNRPLLMSSDDPNTFRTQSTRVVTSLPIPYCLIRLMTHNPIWSYPALMPATLPTNTEPADELSKSRKRIGIDPAEDALLLMGLADFHGAGLSRDDDKEAAVDEETGEPVCHPGQYVAYQFIRKQLLPFRTMLQLRSRRWNLVGSKRGCAGLPSVETSPTDRLALLFRSVSRKKTLKCSMLTQLVKNLAEQAVPYRLAYRCGCLADLSCNDLFSEPGLPKDVGYETVLYNRTAVPRVRKGDISKWIHDIITDFAQQAQCLWWSCSAQGTPQKTAVHISAPSTTNVVRPITSSPGSSASSLVLKTEGSDWTSSRSGPNVLGPTFLPAIPVDLAPDGRVMLSKSSEPALVEVDPDMCVPPSTAVRPSAMTMATQSKRVRGSEYRHNATTSVKAHVESLLQQIRTHTSKTSSAPTFRRVESVLLHPQTLKELANGPTVRGKLPLPPLVSRRYREGSFASSGNTSSILGSKKIHRSVSKRVNTPASNSARISSMDRLPSSEELVKMAARHSAAVANCQQAVDALIETFHSGIDTLLSLHGETLFGPRRFDPIPKSSLMPDSSESNKLATSSACTILASQHDQYKRVPCTPALSFFSNTHVLTISRFLSRCKARGEATTADLLTLASSIMMQRQTALDDMDVRRARSFLDRSRVYLDSHTYGRLVLSLRNLNQVVYQPVVHSFNLPSLTPTERRQTVLNGLGSVLNLLRGHRSLWEDFLCLLTPFQARTIGLLPTYLNLLRVRRAQRVMQDLIPRGKRFWRRLRNLADSCSPDEQNTPVSQTLKNVRMASVTDLDDLTMFTSSEDGGLGTTTSQSAEDATRQSHSTKHVRIRTKGCRTRSPIAKTWALLESTWRSRPILLSRQACLLNVKHKPYSGFEQSFEEIDTLSRNPLKTLDSNELGDPKLDEGWEVCTDLSAVAARRRRLGSGTVSSHSRHCPCPCHPSASSATTPNQTGKPVKADSLGLRHCISCSLKVHRGIVYVDECNFHLRHVEITWPPGFQPKAHLMRANEDQSDRPRTMNAIVGNNLSTRAMIFRLAESHMKSDQEDEQLQLPRLDFARRRVSIEILAPSRPIHISSIFSRNHSARPLNRNTSFYSEDRCGILRPDKREDKLIEDDDLSLGSPTPDPPSPVERVMSPEAVSEIGHFRPASPSTIWIADDDEAACFNTEAFAPKTSVIEPNEPDLDNSLSSFVDTVPWDMEEDRQLLEFSKARGQYSSAMFRDLAAIWVSKPSANGPQRTAEELEGRFKQLMKLMLGDAYDSDLFCSPEHVSSENELN